MEQKTEALANICTTPDVTRRAQPEGSVGSLMNALTFPLINTLYQTLPATVGGATQSKKDIKKRSGNR